MGVESREDSVPWLWKEKVTVIVCSSIYTYVVKYYIHTKYIYTSHVFFVWIFDDIYYIAIDIAAVSQ